MIVVLTDIENLFLLYNEFDKDEAESLINIVSNIYGEPDNFFQNTSKLYGELLTNLTAHNGNSNLSLVLGEEDIIVERKDLEIKELFDTRNLLNITNEELEAMGYETHNQVYDLVLRYLNEFEKYILKFLEIEDSVIGSEYTVWMGEMCRKHNVTIIYLEIVGSVDDTGG